MERMQRMQRTARAGGAAGATAATHLGSAVEMPPVIRRAAPCNDGMAEFQAAHMPGLGGDTANAMQRMRTELDVLRARLADTAPRQVMQEMDHAISVLHQRVKGLSRGRDGADRAEAGLLASELSQMRATLDDLRAPERFRALSVGIEALSRKIDVMDAKAVSPVEVARLQAQSAELAELVRRALSGGGLQMLAERLVACSAQVSRAGDEAARKVEAATAAFEHQARALFERMDRMDAMAREGQETAEPGREISAGMADLQARLDAMTQRLDAFSPTVGSELATRLTALAERLDAMSEADKAATAPHGAAVEHQLLQLAERFDATHARLDRLDDIEAGLFHIIDELQHVRVSSADATAEAVQAVALKVSDAADGPAVVGLKRGLAALEARQDEVERRASAWLGEPFHDNALVLGRTDDGIWTPSAEDIAPASQAAPQPVFEEVLQEAVQDALEDASQEAVTEILEEPFEEVLEEAVPEDLLHAPAVPVEEPRYDEPETFEPLFDVQPEPGQERPHATVRVEPRWVQEDDVGPVSAGSADVHDDTYDTADTARDVPDDVGTAAGTMRYAGRQEPDFNASHAVRHSGRMSAAAYDEGGDGERAARPRVMRSKPVRSRRPRASRVSWKGLAASVVTVAAITSLGFAWANRSAIQNHAMALADTWGASKPVAQAVVSTDDLPAPIGPAALQADAKAGDVAAAYEVGVRYAEGKGVEPNVDAAVKWLGYAVNRGSPQAAYRLGSLYENDIRNMDEARRFYTWAAEQGHVQAMHNLAVLSAQDMDGSGADWQQAIHWFQRAAQYGKRDSQHNLGIIYARGFSGRSDLKEALAWFTIAASQGDADSAEKRDALLQQADPQVKVEANRIAEAFRVRPVNETVNTVAAKPEWIERDDSGNMAGSGAPGTLTPHSLSAQMFSSQSMTGGSASGQIVAARR